MNHKQIQTYKNDVPTYMYLESFCKLYMYILKTLDRNLAAVPRRFLSPPDRQAGGEGREGVRERLTTAHERRHQDKSASENG